MTRKPFALRSSQGWDSPQDSLFGDPAPPVWPRSGSWDLRAAYPSGHSARQITEMSNLLPTPAAGNFNDGEDLDSWEARRQRNLAKGINGNGQGTPLAIAAQQLLKTPTAQLAVNGGSQHPDKRRAGGHGPTLADQVEHLLPTPTTTQRRPDANLETREGAGPNLHNAVTLLPTPRATDGTKGGPNQRGSSGDLMLPSAVMLLPTPTVADSRNSRNSTAGRSPDSTGHSGTTLSDLFWTGESTPSPSAAGNAPPAVPLQGQLSLDGLESD
jgi:hypothetical protein